ncbi:nucleoside-diphosphate kinase [Herbidospora galbida]|uniref:Nucleoside-diphosphate kinase n=1 Tax=Herbidospora galbida TaxID=2575442 RepID=A0A4U3MSE6_9ACTN|nr:nucleoside-diphosphate kinase [Herbidospora galbida]TKK91246.1 nucleoside-diphosphate kinase [Herbidospora galbida]
MASWTYALVTPDALVTQALPGLLDAFRSAGLDPVAAELIRLDADTMLRLYDAPDRALPPHRAFQLWYDLGPACLTLLRHDGADACVVMGRLKGATDPASARPGSLRYAGENVLMNLVHCPDDEASALAELRRLVGPERAEAFRLQAAVPDERVRLLTVGTIEAALPLFGGALALSLPLAVNRLRLRVVQRLAITAVAVEGLLPLLERARVALLEEREELIGLETSPARTAAARARDARGRALLRDAAGVARSPVMERAVDGPSDVVERAVHGLSDVLMGRSGQWAPCHAAIDAAGVFLSDVERAVLEQSHYL